MENFTKEQIKTLRRRVEKYGIRIDDFIEMLAQQNSACGICKKQLVIFGIGKSAIDHCHSSLAIRGILCTPCNLFLGRLEAINRQHHLIDEAERYLERAKSLELKKRVNYLERSSKSGSRLEAELQTDVPRRAGGRPRLYNTDEEKAAANKRNNAVRNARKRNKRNKHVATNLKD